jgi:hypothetical protein
MPLSWNEIRHRAIAFSREWQGETREAAERQSFWNDFFNVFGVRRRTVATFEEPVKKLSGDWGFIDLFWPGRLLAEHKSAGNSLAKVHAQGMTLYNPLTMPAPLLKAHQQLDRAVDRCYRPEPFPSDRHRVEYLFALYEKLTAPLIAAAKPARARPRLQGAAK